VKIGILALSCFLMLAHIASAAQICMSDLLTDGWRILAIAKEAKKKVCFSEVTQCNPEDEEIATIYHLAKDDGFAFCVGSYWWNGNSKSWVCHINKVPGNS
jgi:hypothetical protein